jgi:hypothetical protein
MEKSNKCVESQIIYGLKNRKEKGKIAWAAAFF